MKTAIKIGMMGLSIVLLAGCKEKSHQTEMPAPSISVAMPVVRDITLTKDYPGYLSSDRMVNLVARVNGYLQSSQLVPGAKVKKGDLIFVIEPEVYQNNVTQAEAALNTAKAQVEYARSNYERMKEAAKSGAVSQIQVLQAESTAAEMEASVHNAEAALKTARTNLGYCYIRAPYDGRVTRASYDVGNYINGAVQQRRHHVRQLQYRRQPVHADENDCRPERSERQDAYPCFHTPRTGRTAKLYRDTRLPLSQRRPVDRYAERPRQSRK